TPRFPPLLADDHVQVSGLVEELLDRGHIAIELVVSLGVLVLHLHHVSEVGERIEGVVDTSASMLSNRLDHFVPERRRCRKDEVELRRVTARAHLNALVDLEDDAVERVADPDTESRVAIPELLKDVVVLLGALLKCLEELEGRETNRHPASPLQC